MKSIDRSPFVSIIVPVYNSENFIDNGLGDLLAQTYSDKEIIVIYDESSDNTLKLLEKYEDKVRIIIQKKKTSPASARNVGISHAKGEYISFFDIDDHIDKNKIKIQVEFMENAPDIGLTYTDFEVILKSKNKKRIIINPEWNRDAWLDRQFIAFSSVMVRKAVLDDLHNLYTYYFDNSLSAFDDFDFLIRLSSMANFKRVPFILTGYVLHSSNLSRDWGRMAALRLRILLRNKLYLKFARNLIINTPLIYIDNLIYNYL